MSLLAHTCTCGHPDFHHLRLTGECSYGWCRERCREVKPAAEPEVLPTFDWAGREIERLIPPGGRLGPPKNPVTTCSCDACEATYLELTQELP